MPTVIGYHQVKDTKHWLAVCWNARQIMLNAYPVDAYMRGR